MSWTVWEAGEGDRKEVGEQGNEGEGGRRDVEVHNERNERCEWKCVFAKENGRGGRCHHSLEAHVRGKSLGIWFALALLLLCGGGDWVEKSRKLPYLSRSC